MNEPLNLTRLTRFGVQNFKAIGEYQEIKIKPFNLFFGANNSGKSSIIEAFIYAFEILNGRDFEDVINVEQTGKVIEAGNIARYKNIGYGSNKETVFHFYVWILPFKQEFGLEFSENYIHFYSLEPKDKATVFFQTNGRIELDIHHPIFKMLKVFQNQSSIIPDISTFLMPPSSADINNLLTDKTYNDVCNHFRHKDIVYNLHKTNSSFSLSELAEYHNNSLLLREYEIQLLKNLIITIFSYNLTLYLDIFLSDYRGNKGKINKDIFWNVFLELDEHEGLGFGKRSILWAGPDRSVPVNRLIYSKTELEKIDSIWGRLFREPDILKRVNLFLNNQDLLDFGKEISFQKFTPENSHYSAEHEILYSVKLYDKQKGHYLHLNDIGSGSIHIIDVLVGLLSKESYIAIQQPETHLHPALQAKIMEWIVQAYRGNSYFIETHSEHIIKALQLSIAKRGKSKHNNVFPTSDDVSVCYLRYDKSTYQTIVKEIGLDEVGSFKEPWPDDFFELSADLTMEKLKHNSKSKN